MVGFVEQSWAKVDRGGRGGSQGSDRLSSGADESSDAREFLFVGKPWTQEPGHAGHSLAQASYLGLANNSRSVGILRCHLTTPVAVVSSIPARYEYERGMAR